MLTFYIGTKGNFSELCSQDMSSSWFVPKLKLMIGKLARSPNQRFFFFCGQTAWTHIVTPILEETTFNYSKIHSYIFKVASSLNWNFLRILAHYAPLPFIPTYDELQIISNIYIIYIFFWDYDSLPKGNWHAASKYFLRFTPPPTVYVSLEVVYFLLIITVYLIYLVE